MMSSVMLLKSHNEDVIADYGYTSVYSSDISMKRDIEHLLLGQALVSLCMLR